MTRLDAKDENLCNYTGLFGILISATCLIQHVIFGLDTWLLFAILIVYMMVAASFVLLVLKQWYVHIALIVACVLSAIVEAIHFLAHVFSPISVILFVYTITVTTFLLIENVPAKLALVAAAKKAEENEWREKI